MIQATEIKGLLQSFIANTLYVRGAILTSSKGSSLASALADDLDESKVTANFLPLLEQFKKDSDVGAVEKIMLEGQEGYCVLVDCENELILLVLASKEIVKGWLFLQIKSLIKTISN